MAADQFITLTVVYARSAEQQCLRAVTVPVGVTVQQAIEASEVLTLYPEINLEKNAVGIFNKVVMLDTQVKAGDRVEIYRPLIFDPMTARRARAEKKQTQD